MRNSQIYKSWGSQIVRDRWWLAGCIIIGALYRLFFIASTDAVIDSDEAIVGLMAKHALERGTMPIFYYGQHYMGSLEPLLVAFLFSITGLSAVSMKMVPLAFGVALIPLTYLLGAWFFTDDGSEESSRFSILSGRIAAGLMAVPPAAMVEWSTKARGGFTEVIVLGVVAMLCTLSWYRHLSAVMTFASALCLGVGWWVNNQIVFFMLPIGVVMFFRVVQVGVRFRTAGPFLLHFLLGMATFLVGSVLYWYYNFCHDFASFGMLGAARHLGKNVTGLIESALPIMSGARQFWHDSDLFSGAQYLALGMYLAAIVLIIRVQSLFWKPVFFLSVLTVVTTIIIFTLSAFGSLSTAPRYLLPLYPVIFACVGAGIAGNYLRKPGPVFPRMASIVLCSFFTLHLLSYWWDGGYDPGQPFVAENERASADHAQLLQWLSSRQVSVVQTPYWIAYRLAFETGEKVKPIMIGEPLQIRIPEYEPSDPSKDRREVPPFVVPPKYGERIAEGLRSMGYSFNMAFESGYLVLYDIFAPLGDLNPIPFSRTLGYASLHNESAYAAVDGDITTRWGSGTPQYSGMSFEVHLKEPQVVRALEYDLGLWSTDYPRSLRIECRSVDGDLSLLLPEDDYEKSRVLNFRDVGLLYNFDSAQTCSEVVFTQLGEDSVFDWSIAEVVLYR
jgi:hypothetical protein